MDSSTPAWRVFDAPSTVDGGSPGAPGTGGGNAPRSHALLDLRLAIAGVVGAIAIGGLAVVLLLAGGGGSVVQGPGVAVGSPDPGDQVAFGGGEVVVDVAGAVAKPGIYHLGTGARVGDAIDAAGGFGPRVDVERVGLELNLAAAVTDGQQIRVPSRDDPAPAGGGQGGGASGGGGSRSDGGLVNLNSASESELDTLPGIGPVTAGKIIEARASAPFKTVEELRERGLVGEKTFESLKVLVTVG
ncbi:MAG TPA: ComEA family DNA-binding protein [Candidatus Limnocylindria bacterium]|nr:ComEA family DNA-binding protein [Candidatus Limnocylindria bacterium]